MFNNKLFQQGIEKILQAFHKIDLEQDIGLCELESSLQHNSETLPSLGIGKGGWINTRGNKIKLDVSGKHSDPFFGYGNQDLWTSQLKSCIGVALLQHSSSSWKPLSTLVNQYIYLAGAGMTRGSLFLSPSMANECALKVIHYHQFPASKIIAFEGCFSGNSTALAHITDTPKYSPNHNPWDNTLYLPFANSIQEKNDSLATLKRYIYRYKGGISVFMVELVQGEGGFRFVSRESLIPLLELYQEEGIIIWFKERKSFLHTGYAFSYQTYELENYADIVTCDAVFHNALFLMSSIFHPPESFLQSTFAASSQGVSYALKALELVRSNHYLGKEGKIAPLESLYKEKIKSLQNRLDPKFLTSFSVKGNLISMQILDRNQDVTKNLLKKLFDLGLIVSSWTYGEKATTLIGLIPPFGVLSENEINTMFSLLEQGLQGVS